ncbi:hypothetical protein FN846DRAFT_476737 [Sphaerosporella brunnea]|uniref:Rhodopsin domain-containing protein n=1 Tax=Sphaerosporella brunnea TaxID=1250544 RepID=A0A5J5FBF5_9PEZI|nr:hypothetical protein FN846DRAFT_476737 [Sphaerosporella brunnea]
MFASRTIYTIYVYLIKFGFLAHYLSFSRISSLRMRVYVWVIIVLNFSAAMVVVLKTALWCQPVSDAWSIEFGNVCNPFLHWNMVLINSFTNIGLDILVLAYPYRIVIDSNWSVREKLKNIMLIVFVGSWPIAVGIIRFLLVISTIGAQGVQTSPTNDIALSSLAEMALLLFVVNVPNMKVICRRLAQRRQLRKLHSRPRRDSTSSGPLPQEAHPVRFLATQTAMAKPDRPPQRRSSWFFNRNRVDEGEGIEMLPY